VTLKSAERSLKVIETLKLVPSKSLCAVFYSLSIVTMAVYLFVRYLASKSGVTVKTWLGFVQEKWHHFVHLIDRIRVPIHLRSNYGDILYRLRDIATYW